MKFFLRIIAVASVSCACTAFAADRVVAADGLDAIRPARLAAVHAAVEDLAARRRDVDSDSTLTDYRACIHVHSHHSHDSIGTVEEIRAAAKLAGVDVILFTEHPADTYDFISDGNRGLVDDVLFVPGAETNGFLAFPKQSVEFRGVESPQTFADSVRSADGLVFLSHLEERMDWEISKLTGSEIYNTHADVKDETELLAAMRNPVKLILMKPAMEKYPQEFFASLLDYPADYLARYDRMCQQRPHTGVAANDAHHNQGMRAILTDDGKLRIEDLLGEKLAEIDPSSNPLIKGLVGDKQPGDVVLVVDLDPYERSFRHTSTHLLMSELSEPAVRAALAGGRTYVAFDWMADPSGFDFALRAGDERWPIGAQLPYSEGHSFTAAAPLPSFFRLIRDGREVATGRGRDFSAVADGPGVYRLEAWLIIAGERKPWILTSPIYLGATAEQ